MLCPHCRHSAGLHSDLGQDGRAADGGLLAADYEAGKCHQGDCPCPGWYPDTTPMERMAATMAARTARNKTIAEAPFSLAAPISRGGSVQGDLFQ